MSNVKRKDSKNRNLRNGESQRKDGRYVYKYTDIYGKPQFIYSWKLVPTDKTPAGKRDDISLREKEAQIKKDLNDGIDTAGGKMTVCQLYEKKNSQRKNIKRATEKGRQYLMNALKNDPLGMRAVSYTHLDVYKRQIRDLSNGKPARHFTPLSTLWWCLYYRLHLLPMLPITSRR